MGHDNESEHSCTVNIKLHELQEDNEPSWVVIALEVEVVGVIEGEDESSGDVEVGEDILAATVELDIRIG